MVMRTLPAAFTRADARLARSLRWARITMRASVDACVLLRGSYAP